MMKYHDGQRRKTVDLSVAQRRPETRTFVFSETASGRIRLPLRKIELCVAYSSNIIGADAAACLLDRRLAVGDRRLYCPLRTSLASVER